jgi:hypothetical protein
MKIYAVYNGLQNGAIMAYFIKEENAEKFLKAIGTTISTGHAIIEIETLDNFADNRSDEIAFLEKLSSNITKVILGMIKISDLSWEIHDRIINLRAKQRKSEFIVGKDRDVGTGLIRLK